MSDATEIATSHPWFQIPGAEVLLITHKSVHPPPSAGFFIAKARRREEDICFWPGTFTEDPCEIRPTSYLRAFALKNPAFSFTNRLMGNELR
jgi:hypothetical protein